MVSIRPACRVVHPDLSGGDVDVAVLIHRHAFAALIGEDLEIGQAAIGRERGLPRGHFGLAGDIDRLAGRRRRQSETAQQRAALRRPNSSRR